ncbi:MAG: hypothetical protein MI862_18915, partial [Desulfobacterales bacterium]|nr:hypothetical protein [Desulfobacterales bacterium]
LQDNIRLRTFHGRVPGAWYPIEENLGAGVTLGYRSSHIPMPLETTSYTNDIYQQIWPNGNYLSQVRASAIPDHRVSMTTNLDPFIDRFPHQSPQLDLTYLTVSASLDHLLQYSDYGLKVLYNRPRIQTTAFVTYTYEPFGNASPVPEPSPVLLYGAGLLGLAWLGRRIRVNSD